MNKKNIFLLFLLVITMSLSLFGGTITQTNLYRFSENVEMYKDLSVSNNILVNGSSVATTNYVVDLVNSITQGLMTVIDLSTNMVVAGVLGSYTTNPLFGSNTGIVWNLTVSNIEGAAIGTPSGMVAAGALTGATLVASSALSIVAGNLQIPTNGWGGSGTIGANGTNGMLVVTGVVTLAAGSSAWASNNIVGPTNNVTLGIPQGAAGANGSNGSNGTNGATGSITNIAETVGTYDNATPITITFTNWNQSYSATLTSTGAVIVVFGASGAGVENWMNLTISATGSPSWTWPAKLWHFANGTSSSNAPAASKWGRVEIVTNSLSYFTCQAWTNVPMGGL